MAKYAVVATGFRDTVVAAGADGSHVHVVVCDPFDDTFVGPPRVVADSSVIDARMGLAGNAKSGFIGLWYPYGRRGADASQIRFQLMGPMGEPRGRPLVLVDGLRYAAGCGVGASHSEFIVIYWNAAGVDPIHKMWGQRLRARLER